ncbi:unnamed protein product [Cochlearia groenlandica]
MIETRRSSSASKRFSFTSSPEASSSPHPTKRSKVYHTPNHYPRQQRYSEPEKITTVPSLKMKMLDRRSSSYSLVFL